MVNYPDIQPRKFMVREDDMGVNAPLIHQQVISRIHVGLGVLYYYQKSIPYEPLTETMLGEESNPTPDLLLYDHETEQTRIIIEICGVRGAKADLKKIIDLTESGLYGILEGFVYNYKTQEWFRYRPGSGSLTETTAYSDVLKLDLNQFL